MNTLSSSVEDIAIIGMSGRFPGADNIEIFWKNLVNGVCSITELSDEVILTSGVREEILKRKNYVRSTARLNNIELFDAEFFGYSAKEAEFIDPQHRIFLECAWEAFENAGYDPEGYEGKIGVFGGCSFNHYFFKQIYPYLNEQLNLGEIALILYSNGPDYLCSRVSYKLNLTGPSVSVQTACSTSLVAVHMACQSLLTYESDMALAGGVSIQLPQDQGYLYETGNILSADGFCRAFDAKASGTIFGSGAGIVLLKRLSEAINNKDYIYAIIKGSAVNNDGALKVGFTAPSIDGQAEVIAEAIASAQIDPEKICYIEAHGTATQLGDPIEVAALSKAFNSITNKKRFCALGSVKTNVGHLNAAAGIAGLIKTVLSLKNRIIPASLYFSEANPSINFLDSPFYVNNTLKSLEPNDTKIYAGVSAFGIGGTNAHVVLEEPPVFKIKSSVRQYQLLGFSSRSIERLNYYTSNILKYLTQELNSNTSLSDIAYTLQLGRKAFPIRRMLICSNKNQAVNILSNLNNNEAIDCQEFNESKIIMMFPGQGSQYLGMARETYEKELIFRECVDECSNIIKEHINFDLREILYARDNLELAETKLKDTEVSQVVLFVIEYALAQLWQYWGIKPFGFIGHSVGEYVAACLSGVFTLNDALKIICFRGKLLQSLPTGSMLAVFLPEEDMKQMLSKNISLAAVNASDICVVSGESNEIESLKTKLTNNNIKSRQLNSLRAFHSFMVDPILGSFKNFMQKIDLNQPKIPFISNLTGNWIENNQACDANYWVDHLRNCVSFFKGIQTLKKDPTFLYLEVGPGNTLSGLVKKEGQQFKRVLVSLPVNSKESDLYFLLNTLGKLWTYGIEINWKNFYKSQPCQRVPLPGSSLVRQKYWLETSYNRQNFDIKGFEKSEKKVDNILPSSVHGRPNLASKYTPPRNRLEEFNVEIWSKLLGISGIGVFDNFFELGGHSLLATQMVSRLNLSLPIEISLEEIYESKTIAKLSEIIEIKLTDKIDSLSEEEVETLLKDFFK